MRHAYAVNALRGGDDIKSVQDNLGHRTAAFTLDTYGHVTEQMKRDSAKVPFSQAKLKVLSMFSRAITSFRALLLRYVSSRSTSASFFFKSGSPVSFLDSTAAFSCRYSGKILEI